MLVGWWPCAKILAHKHIGGYISARNCRMVRSVNPCAIHPGIWAHVINLTRKYMNKVEHIVRYHLATGWISRLLLRNTVGSACQPYPTGARSIVARVLQNLCSQMAWIFTLPCLNFILQMCCSHQPV